MRSLMIALVAVFVMSVAAQAHFIELPVKWSQAPWDRYGADWLSDHLAGVVVADDFICDSPDPIVAVRWWGSYLGDPQGMIRPTGMTGPFDISFHISIEPQGGVSHPWSRPGMLVFMDSVIAQEDFVGFDSNGMAVYRYDAYLNFWFWQAEYAHRPLQPGQILGELFLDICKPTQEGWGWHECVPTHPRLDWASLLAGDHMTWINYLETDMAFELMTIPEPATLALLGLGLVGLVAGRKRR